MKRWLLYLIIIVAISLLGISPFQRTDIAQLAPVEVVWLSWEKGRLCLQTDTQDVGYGEDVQSALENMKQTTAGTIFLETADYLIIEQGQEQFLEQVYPVLRPSCMVCVAERMPKMDTVVKFLRNHEPKTTLRQLRNGEGTVKHLIEMEGRFSWREE